MKQRWSSFRGFQMAFFWVSGSSFQQLPALLGGGGAGMSASCCEGAVSRHAAVMPATVQSDLGKRALERHLELCPDGRHHGSGAGRRRRGPHDPRRQPEEVVRELHPRPRRLRPRVSRIWKLTFARKGSRIASRSWSRSTSMASMVKTCCPGSSSAPCGRSSVIAASALGARGSSRGTARTALRPGGPR